MTDTIRKRRENGRRFDAALASWNTSSFVCPACRDAGTIRHEDAEWPCPYCHPDQAAGGATA